MGEDIDSYINVIANLILVNTRNFSGSNQTGDSEAKKMVVSEVTQ